MHLIQDSPWHVPTDEARVEGDVSFPPFDNDHVLGLHTPDERLQLTAMWMRMAKDNRHGIAQPDGDHLMRVSGGKVSPRWKLIDGAAEDFRGAPVSLVSQGRIQLPMWEARIDMIRPLDRSVGIYQGIFASIATAANYPAYMREAMDEGCQIISRLNVYRLSSEGKIFGGESSLNSASLDYTAALLALFWDQLTDEQRPLFFALSSMRTHRTEDTFDGCIEVEMDALATMISDHEWPNVGSEYPNLHFIKNVVGHIFRAFNLYREMSRTSGDKFSRSELKALAMSGRLGWFNFNPNLAGLGFTQQFLDYYGHSHMAQVFNAGITAKRMYEIEALVGETTIAYPEHSLIQADADDPRQPMVDAPGFQQILEQWNHAAGGDADRAQDLIQSYVSAHPSKARFGDMLNMEDDLGEWALCGVLRDDIQDYEERGITPEDLQKMGPAIPRSWIAAW